jgi:hypothetical protein
MYKIIGADQKEYGPVSADDLRRWAAEGRVNAQTLIQAEGQTDWQPLANFPELNAARAVPAAPAPATIGAAPAEKIPNYLVQSILVTLCCCLPGGIAAIVFAAQVNSKQAVGDIAGALESSRKAKKWCWISFGVGLAINVIVAIIQIIAAMGSGLGK